jgi:hypothetical protein
MTEMAGGGGKEEASPRWEHEIGGDEKKSLNAHSFRPHETFSSSVLNRCKSFISADVTLYLIYRESL